jgi:DNA polymerase I-like protein with 3'-5' exonuclease and polymerase domains
LSKKGEGVKVRRAIVPNRNKGHDLIVALDFDGEELRVLAGLSGDKNLLSCYVGDNLRDAHAIVAAQIMGCEYEEFVANRKSSDKAVAKKHDDIRKVAKQVGFASAYGCGVNKLSRIIKEDLETTEMYLNAKKTVYSRLEDWKVEVKEELQAKGMVKTQLGCYRHAFSHYTKSNSDMKSYYERSAVNYLVQGLCAEYLKLVLANIYKSKVLQRHNAVLLAPIYDEVVISVHSSQAISLIKEVYAAMTVGIPGVPVPMLANPSLGVNFGDQIEVLEDCNQGLTDELIQIAINKALGV